MKHKKRFLNKELSPLYAVLLDVLHVKENSSEISKGFNTYKLLSLRNYKMIFVTLSLKIDTFCIGY